jgi:hypothetical protein
MKQLSLLLASTLAVFVPFAEASTWSFTYSNLCDGSNCLALSGTFSGNDSNHDGVVALDELLGLEAGGATFFPTWSSAPGAPPAGGTTYSFSYRIGGALDFIADAQYYRIAVHVATGDSYSIVGPGTPSDNFQWTPETTLAVTPVPEPGTASLLLAGLLALSTRVRLSSCKNLSRASASV